MAFFSISRVPIDASTFLRHLFSCYSTLEDKATDDAGKPAYFRFLTLLSFKIFLEQNVDVAIVEVGLGGRLDATNCIREPVVCGITPLGFDHMALLGHTLPLIAREKAGIFKRGRPAFTVVQREDAHAVLEEVAKNVGCSLQTVKSIDEYSMVTISPGTKRGDDTVSHSHDDTQSSTSTGRRSAAAHVSAQDGLHIGLAGQHQRQNASLAVTLAAQWEATSATAAARAGPAARQRADSVLCNSVLPPEYVHGLETATWPGRGHIVHDTLEQGSAPSPSQLIFYLDGAHTAESMKTCAEWFLDEISLYNNNTWYNAATSGAEGSVVNRVPYASAISSEQSSLYRHHHVASTHRILLFNCMEERHPEDLLAPLVSTLMQQERNAMPHHAFFLPPESSYMKVGSKDHNSNGTNTIDLSWQMTVRDTWERLLMAHGLHRTTMGSSPAASVAFSALPAARTIPSIPIVPGIPGPQDPTKGAVLPSIRMALDWLRRCAKERPSVKMQVLVTGSLYLVGDLLRILHSR